MDSFRLIIALCLCFLSVHADDEVVRYDGHKVIRVHASNVEELEWLKDLHHNSEIDFWTHPRLNYPTDIRLEPTETEEVLNHLEENNYNYTILHHDVQRLIEELGQHPHSDKRSLITADLATETFPTYQAIYDWVLQKQREYPSLVSLSSIGNTYEGRPMYLVKLSTGGSSNKPAIWLDSGIHAREWLSVATTVNIIDMMLKLHAVKESSVVEILNRFDWYFLPVANPDGYEYSHQNGGRLWRKTRTRYTYSIGADPNRNFGYYWCITGSSRVETSDQFCGGSEWSERCVANMKTTLEGLRSRLKVYMTLHSYGEMFFLPYAWSRIAYPPDYNHMLDVANNAVRAMRQAAGVSFKVGRVPDLLYEASGSAMDWVKGSLGVPYSYAMELRPHSYTSNGFITPTSQIKPSATEVWAGLLSIAQQAANNL